MQKSIVLRLYMVLGDSVFLMGKKILYYLVHSVPFRAFVLPQKKLFTSSVLRVNVFDVVDGICSRNLEELVYK